jgi:hypothetical protein
LQGVAPQKPKHLSWLHRPRLLVIPYSLIPGSAEQSEVALAMHLCDAMHPDGIVLTEKARADSFTLPKF